MNKFRAGTPAPRTPAAPPKNEWGEWLPTALLHPNVKTRPFGQSWQNKKYHVFISKELGCIPPFGEVVHLWIIAHVLNGYDSKLHIWADFQRIKNELLGAEWEGVEIYPAEADKVNEADMYHLFCWKSDAFKLPFWDAEKIKVYKERGR